MSDLIYTVIVLLLFFSIAFIGIKKNDNQDISTMLTKYNSLRGLLAIEVLLGHVVQNESGTNLTIFTSFMIVSVGFFFFVSSFGMSNSYRVKYNYLGRYFLFRKCGYLMFIAILVYLFSLGVSYFTGCYVWKFNSFIDMVVGFPDRTNWYIFELMAFYFLFYLTYKFFSSPLTRCIIVFIVSVVIITLLFCFGVQEKYYASTLCFSFGILAGEYYEQVKRFLLSIKGLIVCSLVTMGGLTSVIYKQGIFALCYSKNLLCIAFILFIFLFMSKFELNNKVITFLMKMSTEIYLCSFLWVYTLAPTEMNYMIRVPMVFIATIISALIIYPICNFMKKKLK